jgi:cytochrome c1
MKRMLLLGLVVLAAAGCGSTAAIVVQGGHDSAGKGAIRAYGCGGCHEIPGVDQASGKVGPSLHDLASRRYIAGTLPNTPDDLVRWIEDPQGVQPGTLMPNLGVSDQAAKDIAAYLYEH